MGTAEPPGRRPGGGDQDRILWDEIVRLLDPEAVKISRLLDPGAVKIFRLLDPEAVKIFRLLDPEAVEGENCPLFIS